MSEALTKLYGHRGKETAVCDAHH